MRQSGAYTHGHHDSVLRSHRWRTAANSAAYLLPHLRPGLDLLDVGCGPGTITVDLAGIVAPGRTQGVDAAPDVLEEARTGAAARAVPVTFSVGDALALPFAEETWDVVHAHQVLQHLADPVAALREWRRVTRRGGLLAVRDADYAGMTWYPEDPLLDRWLELYRSAARTNGGEPDAGRRLVAWAHRAGLSGVTATASVWCFAEPLDRAWWGESWAERVTATALAEQLRAEARVSADELAAIGEAFRRWAANPDGWFIVPHGEILARVP